MALERMESNIMALLRYDMECITEIHCLKLYCQRLGCNLSDRAAVRHVAGCAFALATEALSDIVILQFPPSLTAAAILVAARRAQARARCIMFTLYQMRLCLLSLLYLTQACVAMYAPLPVLLANFLTCINVQGLPATCASEEVLCQQCTAVQGTVPFWPSVLSQMTGYTEASSPVFASAIAQAGRLCRKLYTSAEATAPMAPALPQKAQNLLP